VELLAQVLAVELGWSVNEGSEYDKVVSVFALNTVRGIEHGDGRPSPMNGGQAKADAVQIDGHAWG